MSETLGKFTCLLARLQGSHTLNRGASVFDLRLNHHRPKFESAVLSRPSVSGGDEAEIGVNAGSHELTRERWHDALQGQKTNASKAHDVPWKTGAAGY